MKDIPIHEDIAAKVKLGHYEFDDTVAYELDESCDWVNQLLDELEENIDKEDSEYERGTIRSELSLKRKSGKPFGDHLLIKGELAAQYQAPCVRCLKLTPQSVDFTMQAGFIPAHLEKQPEFEELDDIFTENEEWALYFHDKGEADISEMVHENLFMNIEHFPLHDPDCLGLCPECGQNLNERTCKHQKQ